MGAWSLLLVVFLTTTLGLFAISYVAYITLENKKKIEKIYSDLMDQTITLDRFISESNSSLLKVLDPIVDNNQGVLRVLDKTINKIINLDAKLEQIKETTDPSRDNGDVIIGTTGVLVTCDGANTLHIPKEHSLMPYKSNSAVMVTDDALVLTQDVNVEVSSLLGKNHTVYNDNIIDSAGMGRYYSETIDDDNQTINLSFAVPTNDDTDNFPYHDLTSTEAVARGKLINLFNDNLLSEELFNKIPSIGYIEVLNEYNKNNVNDNGLTSKEAEARYAVMDLYNKGLLDDADLKEAESMGFEKVLDTYKLTTRIDGVIEGKSNSNKDESVIPAHDNSIVNADYNVMVKTVDLRFNITLKADKRSISLEDIDVTPIEVSAIGEVIDPKTVQVIPQTMEEVLKRGRD